MAEKETVNSTENSSFTKESWSHTLSDSLASLKKVPGLRRLDPFFDELSQGLRGAGTSPGLALLRSSASLLDSARDFLKADVDIQETEDAYLITIDVPGVDREDISVEATNHFLTIKAARTSAGQTKRAGGLFRERRSSRFERTFPLPVDVVIDRATAQVEHGELKVILPRRAESLSRRIPVVAAEDARRASEESERSATLDMMNMRMEDEGNMQTPEGDIRPTTSNARSEAQTSAPAAQGHGSASSSAGHSTAEEMDADFSPSPTAPPTPSAARKGTSTRASGGGGGGGKSRAGATSGGREAARRVGATTAGPGTPTTQHLEEEASTSPATSAEQDDEDSATGFVDASSESLIEAGRENADGAAASKKAAVNPDELHLTGLAGTE